MTAACKNPYTATQIISQVFPSQSDDLRPQGRRSSYFYVPGTTTVFQVNSVSSYNFPRAQLQHLFKGQP